MKNAIKTCCEELKNNYTLGQAGGIGIYYYDAVDGEYIENPRSICVWFNTVPTIHDIKILSFLR